MNPGVSDFEPPGGEQAISARAVGTLVWLAESQGIDRSRWHIVDRLRSVRDSDEFATLPEDLRQRVREIVSGSV